VGVVVGATVGAGVVSRLRADLDVHGPLLAPGIGAQGATAADLEAVFGTVRSAVLPSSSREVLRGGPSVRGLRQAAERTLVDVRSALAGQASPALPPAGPSR
jgi:orotidine-5'-phosphate decarboxylase